MQDCRINGLEAMKRVDDFRLKLGSQELVPIMIGGMGVDISTTDLALEQPGWAASATSPTR
jgi:hypothetical protein